MWPGRMIIIWWKSKGYNKSRCVENTIDTPAFTKYNIGYTIFCSTRLYIKKGNDYVN